MPFVSRRRLLPATLLAMALPLLAQQGAFAFRHFHQYPVSGQWSTDTVVTRDGKPLAPPMSNTACASPLSASRRAEIMKTGNDAAPNCKMTVLHDEERTAEVEQVCSGPVEQTIHTTLHAVDDKTISIEVRSAIAGQPETVARSTSHFLGVCTASQAAEAQAASTAPLPTFKPSPEDCAEMASTRQQAEEGLKGCESADLPDDMRPRCRTQMQAMLKTVAQVEHSCKQ